MSKIIILIIGLSALVPCVVLAQPPSPITINPTEKFPDLIEMVLKVIEGFPATFQTAFQQAISLWQTAYQQLKAWWEANLASKFHFGAFSWWQKLKTLVLERIEIFKAEFPKEKAEMKQDLQKLPQLLWDLWEKIKEALK